MNPAEHDMPTDALIVRRTEVVVFLNEDGDPELSVVADDGANSDAPTDVLAHVGDLTVAQFELWRER
ncbi:hypothetical protein SEA_AFFECA_14 [Gordonia phage Affeca]|uniref:Uncharacterized protein n=3 Tax=Vividuovirus TaxID=2560251 RepID=A0A142K9R2_9CAUD|nr:hypothetical protein BJD57_gp13 [Gordonia phage Vivi2]YP_010097907.1 hypothetical protein KNU06_gp14 [Gordonia phage Angelicage]YP_010104511.1 hypothetical protein KNU77_gp15 [Gordonia phage Keitabear]AYR02397.1 hypothetical protein SEA_AFFECA_14 [Gordonia phage Affeca]QWT30145.1 hypothetical protein SEA_SEDONA_15 [Gordonia phage Sedona]UVT31815.1 hypothetical protein SEA_KEWPIEDOLL_15 [Gordonia phage Kewpiedoll]UYL87689.1 hypothetical protein SEA_SHIVANISHOLA_14 [Gordonia phage Shivanisho